MAFLHFKLESLIEAILIGALYFDKNHSISWGGLHKDFENGIMNNYSLHEVKYEV